MLDVMVNTKWNILVLLKHKKFTLTITLHLKVNKTILYNSNILFGVHVQFV